ncbi:HD domain-containing protein [Hymenobacter mucosus]|uniref:Histidine kinase-, DNA gyrase B-, and HSP90-like ATPase n=1 Tax=Hymenobacter mucosus TaxID=1411120 RepID=A0A238XS68_9BACT|nr:ATP-binding protein [Hymenobacter mucosus]SNR60859.1 Histidine kinase-, DNA gyrase B-, and HSP90-like ATPase [Hymenobacter mucosus]
MSTLRIESTSLWLSSLAARPDDQHSIKRDELRAAFFKFRQNASQLVAQIANHLPGLTKHDVTHLDALWETASLVAGEEYPLNALEGFVLGGAILLHDSALCFEAYDNGISGVRATTTWKDAFAIAFEENKEEAESIADFAALRHLHASQATRLVEKSWSDPDTGEPFFLIEDQSLRKHLGQLIGQIAASHHWDIDKVAATFPVQTNAPASFPRNWRIDPVKIACLLRCADAAHLDNERAPDFLYALLKRKGISFNHWQAQNRLSSVDLDQSDLSQSTILFTSTRNFTEEESESWWVAFDAATVVDKEIRSCNALLESRNVPTPQFKVKRVRGVESPEMMIPYIKAEGWSPCSAEIHVGNVERLIRNLGGDKLYGTDSDKLFIVVRELVQNSRDAVHARRVMEPSFEGKISIRIQSKDGDDWLIIEDNGVGMTERVLTGPLLDFGTSLWKSALVQSEFPGLLSSNFKSSGQFGVGFYSIFMISEEVYITSKPWREGINNAKQLHFKNGLSLRPLLKRGIVEGFNSTSSTQVKLRLKDGILPNNSTVEVRRQTINSTNFDIPLDKYFATIVAGLDVSVFFSLQNSEETEIHHDISNKEFNKEKWLENISYANYQSSQNTLEYLHNNFHRLRYIKENGKILGLAALSSYPSSEHNFLNIRTVSGLATSIHGRNASDYIGFIDYLPESARRDGIQYTASKSTMLEWAQEQYDMLKEHDLDPFSRYSTASSLCHFGIDPTLIGRILVLINNQYIFLSFDQIAELAERIKIGFFKSSFGNYIETNHETTPMDEYALIRPLQAGNFITLNLSSGFPPNDNSIADCIHRAIVKRGKTPLWTTESSVIKSFFGMIDFVTLSIQ